MRDGLGALLPRLRRFAARCAFNVQDADDLVQVTLERALALASQWRPEQRLDGWVYAILRNAWIDEHARAVAAPACSPRKRPVPTSARAETPAARSPCRRRCSNCLASSAS